MGWLPLRATPDGVVTVIAPLVRAPFGRTATSLREPALVILAYRPSTRTVLSCLSPLKFRPSMRTLSALHRTALILGAGAAAVVAAAGAAVRVMAVRLPTASYW